MKPIDDDSGSTPIELSSASFVTTIRNGKDNEVGDHGRDMVAGGPEGRNRIQDPILVLRCQVGDESAFQDLFERFGPRSLRYLQGLVGPDAAEDAQQEVWLAVYKRIAGLSNPGAFRTWLYQISRHRAIDILRKESRESEVRTTVGMETPEHTGEDPGLALDDLDVRSLEAGLSILSDSHREVVLLRYWEEMSYRDIALITGCSVGTVRSRLHHAKRRLREALLERVEGSPETAEAEEGEK